MKQTPFVIDVRPVRSEKISAKEYLRIVANDPTLIDRSEFIPPKAGQNDFGAFFVKYSRARHKSPVHG